MTIFEQAKARADTIAPPPVDRPPAAAATAFGFGVGVVGLFVILQWLGVPLWLGWLATALAYGGIAWADCQLGWTRNREQYREALEELKERGGGPSMH
jgi:hypothetical protein